MIPRPRRGAPFPERREDPRGVSHAVAALAVLAASVLVAAPAAGAGPVEQGDSEGVTAIAVRAAGPPRYVVGDDGRKHIEYDLVVTNGFQVEVTLKSLLVRARGRKLLALTGERLAAHTHEIGAAEPTRIVPRSSAVVILVDVVLPRGRQVPKRLSDNVGYAVAPSPLTPLIGSYTVHAPHLRVDRRKPTVIAPPLRGPGWLNGNGCCDPDTPHRSAIVPADGSFVTFETFAIDWVRVRGGLFFHGSGTEVGDYAAFGARIHSVADGRVVSVANHRPEAPVTLGGIAPTVSEAAQFPGNNAVVKIGPGKYAVYAHMQPNSVRVRPGERVRTGQVIGLLGNSGNSNNPHLHFSIQDSPHPLTSTSLPYVIDRFGFEGRGGPGATFGQITVTGNPHRERRSYPLNRTIANFSR